MASEMLHYLVVRYKIKKCFFVKFFFLVNWIIVHIIIVAVGCVIRYVYCVKCFGEIQGNTITVGDDPLTATIIPKSHFKEMKNNSIDREG